MFDFSVKDRVATVSMRNEPVNALTLAFVEQLELLVDDLETRDDWNVVIIRSDLKIFSAGGDLAGMLSWMSAADADKRVAAYAHRVQQLMARFENLPGVTIAFVEGAALGGGLELALSCDLRIATAKAKFGLPELKVGLLPAAGGTQRLTRQCGRGVATRIMLVGDILSAAEAVHVNLVEMLWENDQAEAELAVIAGRIAAMPREALGIVKGCIAGQDAADTDGFALEIIGIEKLVAGGEAKKRIARFMQRPDA
ncbi:enoyl-CoA hydratase/isomerase family protein [uncultured Sneathiella sp.]|jgi:enoyl-CoA hydratase/carnithine racemase|uniref:enoyl-CoA hydratase/isomerase family protein n=1 Tax=uncultured Sneathiella sp. TaxID=879315 RepID=UPI0030DBF30D|tara:strand:- start:19048 stop:19809 length:762 start_codon:yes stop_codon:yes gene_type:complete